MIQAIKILIVDDSPLMQRMLTSLLSEDERIHVVGVASDPYEAREKIKALQPDVLTLDVEMPRMDGLSFLSKLMSLRPMPVVMVSTLTGKGTDVTIAALQIGAVEAIAKPVVQNDIALQHFAQALIGKILIAAAARILLPRPTATMVQQAPLATQPQSGTSSPRRSKHAPSLIAIGASTGGVEALAAILTTLPASMPPIVITQHMPEGFTASFANRINKQSALEIMQASEGLPLQEGRAIIACGGSHLTLKRSAGQLQCHIDDSPAVMGHKPSVDVMFHSVAETVGSMALGVILTGMGKDGGQGLLAMRHAGSHTIGQDEASSVVYGMPRYAAAIGAVAETLPLHRIPAALTQRCFANSMNSVYGAHGGT